MPSYLQQAKKAAKANEKVNPRLNMNSKSMRPQSSPQKKKSGRPMTEDEGAAKIQAGFRGMKVRKERKEQDQAASKIQAGFRGMKVRKERQEQDQAASKIQAGFKGMKERRKLDKAKELQKFTKAHNGGQKKKQKRVMPNTRGNAGLSLKGNSDGKRVGKWTKQGGKMVRASGPPAPVTFASFGEDREPRGGKKKKAEGGSPRKGLRAGGGSPRKAGGGKGRGMGARSASSGMGGFGF